MKPTGLKTLYGDNDKMVERSILAVKTFGFSFSVCHGI